MSHQHTHSHTQQRLGLTIVLNVVITISQFIGGMISGSLALISDATHNLSDGVAVLLAYIADRLSHKERTAKSTFGYKRAEILAAFINSLVLIAISFYLMIEAVERFVDPKAVDFRWMLWLGALGLVANSLSVFLLHEDKHNNLNVKAAYLHLLGDALTSLAVIIGAVFIWLWNWSWIDPLVTMLISFYLLFHTFKLLKESAEILMQFAPTNINTEELKKQIEKLEHVHRVHHIHLWRLTDRTVHFEAHVELDLDLHLSKTDKINEEITRLLHREFSIGHVTLQFEFARPDCCEC